MRFVPSERVSNPLSHLFHEYNVHLYCLYVVHAGTPNGKSLTPKSIYLAVYLMLVGCVSLALVAQVQTQDRRGPALDQFFKGMQLLW